MEERKWVEGESSGDRKGRNCRKQLTKSYWADMGTCRSEGHIMHGFKNNPSIEGSPVEERGRGAWEGEGGERRH